MTNSSSIGFSLATKTQLQRRNADAHLTQNPLQFSEYPQQFLELMVSADFTAGNSEKHPLFRAAVPDTHPSPGAVPLSLGSSVPVTCALLGFAPGAVEGGGPAPPPRSMQDGGGGCPRFSNTLWSCWQRNRGGTSRGM